MSSTSPDIATPAFFWAIPSEMQSFVDRAAEIEATLVAQGESQPSLILGIDPPSPAARAWISIWPGMRNAIHRRHCDALPADLIRSFAELAMTKVAAHGKPVERPANHFALIHRATYESRAQENGHFVTTAIQRWARLPVDDGDAPGERLLTFDEQCARDRVNRSGRTEDIATIHIASNPDMQPIFPNVVGEMHLFRPQTVIHLRTDGVQLQMHYSQIARFTNVTTIAPTVERVAALQAYTDQLRPKD